MPDNNKVREVQTTVERCIRGLQDEDGRTKTRELALAATKLEEASMWIRQHLDKTA